MRTKEEIDRQIKGLLNAKANIPEFSFFGDNNWAPIDTQLEILNGVDYEKFADEEYEIESAAYSANEWLNGNIDEDLFEE